MTGFNRVVAIVMGALIAMAIIGAAASWLVLVDEVFLEPKRAVVGWGEALISSPDGAELLVSVEFRANGTVRWRAAGEE
jgi:hypothetical protein